MNIIKFNSDTLRQAVNEWIIDPKEAKRKYGHISYWDTSQVLSMTFLFNEAVNFNQDINTKIVKLKNGSSYVAWDTSNVTNMSYMFFNAIKFNKSISNWNTSQVIDMSHMFYGASSFNQIINSKMIILNDKNKYVTWNIDKVNDMTNIFNQNFNKDCKPDGKAYPGICCINKNKCKKNKNNGSNLILMMILVLIFIINIKK